MFIAVLALAVFVIPDLAAVKFVMWPVGNLAFTACAKKMCVSRKTRCLGRRMRVLTTKDAFLAFGTLLEWFTELFAGLLTNIAGRHILDVVEWTGSVLTPDPNLTSEFH